MAKKDFYATGDFRYGTRMLRAGDGPIVMDAPTARLYSALGKISPDKPKSAAAPPPKAAPAQAPAAAAPRPPAAPKAPAKRKRTRKAKAAK